VPITRFMFDTNIFNHIIDGNLSLGAVKDIEFFVTHIQRDELDATSNEERRKELLKVFKVVNQVLIPTESGVWGVSRWGLFKWGKKNGLYDRILKQLEKEKPHDRGNKKDALIGETAVKMGITLVSDDGVLRETVRKLGGVSICLSDFLKQTEDKS
jgi:rRNA-processing protein FCF1